MERIGNFSFMNRRKAIQNVGFLTGSMFLLPYACEQEPELVYSNFPLFKRKDQTLVSLLCNAILAEDPINFPTTENRGQFVMTMINDCGSPREISIFVGGMEAFKTSLSPTHELDFANLTPEEQNKFLEHQFYASTVVTEFLNLLKKYCLLHFETSENYLTQYLNYEFMPGHYLGRVAI